MDLKTLTGIQAPSGDEKRLRRAILEEARKLCGEENVRIDRMGNVLCHKKGTAVSSLFHFSFLRSFFVFTGRQ